MRGAWPVPGLKEIRELPPRATAWQPFNEASTHTEVSVRDNCHCFFPLHAWTSMCNCSHACAAGPMCSVRTVSSQIILLESPCGRQPDCACGSKSRIVDYGHRCGSNVTVLPNAIGHVLSIGVLVVARRINTDGTQLCHEQPSCAFGAACNACALAAAGPAQRALSDADMHGCVLHAAVMTACLRTGMWGFFVTAMIVNTSIYFQGLLPRHSAWCSCTRILASHVASLLVRDVP